MGLGLKIGGSKNYKLTGLGTYSSEFNSNASWTIDIKKYSGNYASFTSNNFFLTWGSYHGFSYFVGQNSGAHEFDGGFSKTYNASNGILSISSIMKADNAISVKCVCAVYMAEAI